VALLIAAAASGQPVQLIIAAGLLAPSFVILLLAPRTESSRRLHPSIGASISATRVARRVPLVGLAVIAMPPTIAYAAAMVEAAITAVPEPSYTYVFDHYPVQAACALVIPLSTALLAVGLPGWRPMTFLVAAGTAWFGLVSIVHPAHLGSWGAVWGWTAVGWALALAMLAIPFDRHRRDPGK